MEDIEPINEKSEGDCGYVAGFKNRKIALYAGSLYAGKRIAEEHFRPSKKDQGLLWISLAERADGSTVLQSTAG